MSREERFMLQPNEMVVVKKSGSNLIVTSEVIARGIARVQAGEDINKVASDIATEELVLRAKLDNPEWSGE